MTIEDTEIYYNNIIAHIIKYELFRHRGLLSKFPIPFNRTMTDVIASLCKSFYQGKEASTSDIYLGSGLSKSTAISTIKQLVKLKIIEKNPSTKDRRRVAIKFTDHYQNILTQYAIDCAYELQPFSATEATLAECLKCDHRRKINTLDLSNITHEFRTPLNAISGYAEMIEMGMAKPGDMPAYHQYASIIKEASNHLLNLVNDILDLSQFENSGSLPIHPNTFNIGKLINTCKNLVAPQAKRKEISVNIHVADDISNLIADERRIMQVLINLISNAVQYSPQNSVITIEAILGERGQILIVVSDSGPGIPDKDLLIALEPFGRLTHHTETNIQGNGIGLPLSKSIMDVHGGELILSNKPEGGLTVTAAFPADRTSPRIAA